MRFLRYIGRVLFSLVLNIHWSIPAWVLLVLHFTCGVPLWCFFAALAVWIVAVRLYCRFVGKLVRLGNADEKQTVNKNPYSNKNKEDKNDIR